MKKFVLPQLASSIAQLCAKPHSYRSVNNTSQQNSCFLTMQHLLPRVVTILVLAFMCDGVWGQTTVDNCYVFRHATRGFLYNNDGTLRCTTTFSPSCVWIASGELGTTARNIKSYSNQSQYLVLNQKQNKGTASINTNSWGNWYVFDNKLCTYNVSGYNNNLYTTNGTDYRSSYDNTYMPANCFTPTIVTVNKFNSHLETFEIVSQKNILSSARETSTSSASTYYQPEYTNYYFDNTNHYFNVSGSSIANLPTLVTSGITYTWSLEGIDSEYAIVNSSTGVVTYSKLIESPSQTATLKCTATYTATSETETATYKITFKNPNILEKPAISYANASTSNKVTVTLSSSETDVDIYYTTDGSTAPSSTSGTKYTEPFEVTSGTTIKAIAVRGTTVSSAVVSQKVEFIKQGVSGEVVTLDDREDHNWSYYKGLDYIIKNPDGTTISYKDKYRYSIYSPDPRNVKITYRGFNTDANTIILGSNTVNTSTLNSNTTPHVSNATGEGQNTFVYYETLEKFVIGFFEQHKTGDDYDGTPTNPNNTAEQYPYTVISNPFSVRPSTGTTNKTYYGFAGWKIISGGEHIQNHANNDVLALDEIIHFTDLENIAGGKYTPNCTSAEVVLEATWTQANVVSANTAQTFSSGTYETNFIVASGDITGITQSSPCTIMAAYYPDGTANTNRTITGLTVSTTGTTPATNTVKVEYIRHGNGTFNANGKNMILGRGITSSSSQGTIYGCNADKNCVNIVKLESGNYYTVTPINKEISATNAVNTYFIFGCDYDKALADYYSTTTNAYNTKLQASGTNWSGMGEVHRPNGILYLRTLFKSGTFPAQYYTHKSSHTGQRFVTIEGGHFQNDITGGSETKETQPNARAFTLRAKGNFQVDGRIAGGSSSNNCSGDRCLIFTGGRVGGWIAAGSNSRTDSGGVTTGETFVYIGGNARIDSNNEKDKLFNTSSGGVVYGAGCGINHESTSGAVTKGSNVVLADAAYVERGIYGGGAMGRINKDQGSNIFVLGGHVGTGVGKITDSKNPEGQQNVEVSKSGVFGGACNVGGGYSNIYMNGGIVEGGIFGGSNISGTMDNNVRIQIDGGQVGLDATHPANIHGGGYGASTKVSGNVEVTLGQLGQKGATLYGNVYGGSALGQVNTNTDNHTWVTMNSGSIHGSLFGGGMGELKSDYSSTSTKPFYVAYEGVVNGTIKVVVNGTDPTILSGTNNETKTYAVDAVFGGCDLVAYAGTPVVEIHNCESSIGYVYGGGNASDVQHTDVTVWGGDINYVFGGGNGEDTSKPGADIVGTSTIDKGNTNVRIYGGTINYIFGGSNLRGNVSGTASVLLDEQAEEGKDPCPILVQEAYGGANKAPMDGKPMLSIGCLSGRLENVYGGSKAVDVNSDIVLNITSGQFGKVFGGNNESGEIKGSITVNIDETGCHPIVIDELYAGGNMAAYTTPAGKSQPTVNVISCTHIGQVFGGGYGATAIVTGNPIVNIQQIPGAYDPDDTDGTDGWTANPGTKLGTIGTVFGGGNAANVVGDTYVNIGTQANNKHLTTGATDTPCGANITGNVYGGGNQADVTGKTHVQVGPTN